MQFNLNDIPKGLTPNISPKALDIWSKSPQSLANSEDNTINIFSEIGDNWWGDSINAAFISRELSRIGAENPVTVYVNSPGGSVFEGFAIYNQLKMHKGDVTVKVIGIAASAAAVIAMAADTLEVARAGFLMIHNSWVCACGNRHELRDTADFLEPFDAAMVDIFAERSGLTSKEIIKLLDAETWMSGADSLDKGFSDAIIDDIAFSEDLDNNQNTAAKLIDVAMAKAGVPRSERRKIINQFKVGTLSAADKDTPGAISNGDAINLSKQLLEILP